MDFTTITYYDLMLMPLLGGKQSDFADTIALTLTSALTWIPMYAALLYAVIRKWNAVKPVMHILLCAGICILLADGMADGIVKPLTERLRPLNDPESRKIITLVDGAEDSNYSFFSAHAANTFSICVFFSLMMRNAWLTLSLTTWSLINCWTRIYLGMHYPSDILVGLIWGGVSGYIAYYVSKNIKRKTTEQDISDKFRYSQRDILSVTTIIAATLVFAIIYAAI